LISLYLLYPNGYNYNNLSNFIPELTQKELSAKAGVGLRLIRDMEQGKASLRIDKVNQVLSLFGAHLSVELKQK
jgi:predicted transcriptional regulator